MAIDQPHEATTVHLSPEARAELDALAREQHRDPAELLSEAVAAYVDAQRCDLAAIHQGLRQAESGEFGTPAEVDAAYATFG